MPVKETFLEVFMIPGIRQMVIGLVLALWSFAVFGAGWVLAFIVRLEAASLDDLELASSIGTYSTFLAAVLAAAALVLLLLAGHIFLARTWHWPDKEVK